MKLQKLFSMNLSSSVSSSMSSFSVQLLCRASMSSFRSSSLPRFSVSSFYVELLCIKLSCRTICRTFKSMSLSSSLSSFFLCRISLSSFSVEHSFELNRDLSISGDLKYVDRLRSTAISIQIARQRFAYTVFLLPFALIITWSP